MRRPSAKREKMDDLEDDVNFFEEPESAEQVSEDEESLSDQLKLKKNLPESVRLREGKKYLKKLIEMNTMKNGQLDDDYIKSRLLKDAMENVHKTPFRKIASLIGDVEIKYLKGHKDTVTCVVVTEDEKVVFSGSKDCCIIKWDLKSAKKLKVIKGEKKKDSNLIGHKNHILDLAVSSDGKYLASCSMEKQIYIWNLENWNLEKLSGHMDSVTGVVFRAGNHDLYSCSMDRSVKVWDCDQMMYVQTMYGHQAPVYAIDALSRERCVTCSQDKTVSVWKVVEQSRMEYRGTDSIEVISLINESTFVSGTQGGSIQLWSSASRSPVFVVKDAHQVTDKSCQFGWICSISALKYSDVFASGSGNGKIVIWKLHDTLKSFSQIKTLNICGMVNSIKFSNSGNYLIAALGKDHKLGRWITNRQAKNSIAIAQLLPNCD